MGSTYTSPAYYTEILKYMFITHDDFIKTALNTKLCNHGNVLHAMTNVNPR